MSSKAVLFGIDYLTSDKPLRGCANDVKNMSQYLKDTLEYDVVRVYTEQDTPTKVTAQNIIRILHKTAIESWSMRLRRVFIHFSGHGVSVADRNKDESDGKDEAICPVDYRDAGVITDDILKRLFRYFNPATKVTCVFDCCHSGTIGDLTYRLSDTNEHTIESKDSACAADIVLISGCRDDQTSADAYGVTGTAEYSGAMTSCLLDCIRYRKQLKGSIDAVTLVNDVRLLLSRKGFTQVPIITSSRDIREDTIIF
jgi:hypothetical protein